MELINFYANIAENCQYTCILLLSYSYAMLCYDIHTHSAIVWNMFFFVRLHILLMELVLFSYSLSLVLPFIFLIFLFSYLKCACDQIEYFQIAHGILMKGQKNVCSEKKYKHIEFFSLLLIGEKKTEEYLRLFRLYLSTLLHIQFLVAIDGTFHFIILYFLCIIICLCTI